MDSEKAVSWKEVTELRAGDRHPGLAISSTAAPKGRHPQARGNALGAHHTPDHRSPEGAAPPPPDSRRASIPPYLAPLGLYSTLRNEFVCLPETQGVALGSFLLPLQGNRPCTASCRYSTTFTPSRVLPRMVQEETSTALPQSRHNLDGGRRSFKGRKRFRECLSFVQWLRTRRSRGRPPPVIPAVR